MLNRIKNAIAKFMLTNDERIALENPVGYERLVIIDGRVVWLNRM